MEEIVAIQVGDLISNDIKTLLPLIKHAPFRLLSRWEMQIMSSCGVQWDNLATGKTLFVLQDDGSITAK